MPHDCTASTITRPSLIPLPRNPRYLTLDHWRGIACLMIVILHATHYCNQNFASAGILGKAIISITSKFGMGVPIFFVISGYCICASADAARRKPRSPTHFFYRRFRRIFPPYWILALISLVLVVTLTRIGLKDLIADDYGYIPHPAELSWSQWIGNITLTETWRHHFFGEGELKIVGPAWTLCYEEQFYAVCGFILLVSPRYFFTYAAIVTLCTLAIASYAIMRPDRLPIQGFFFDGRWLMFAEGIAVYYLINYARFFRFGIGAFCIVLLGLCVLRWCIHVGSINSFARGLIWDLVTCTVFSLALLLLHSRDKQIAMLRILYPIRLCGQMCYSLYLVHWPTTVIVTNTFYLQGVNGFWDTLLIAAPTAIGLSLVFSWIFYLTIERRFTNAVSPITSGT